MIAAVFKSIGSYDDFHLGADNLPHFTLSAIFPRVLQLFTAEETLLKSIYTRKI